MAFPGVLVVWSGTKPRLDVHRIGDGLVLGRDLADPADDLISRAHARLTTNEAGQVVVADLAGRNGTYVHGGKIAASSAHVIRLPAIVRTGRTISVVVEDVRPYENVPLSQRGTLVLGGSLERSARAVDMAAVEAHNLALVGPMAVAIELAHSYGVAMTGPVVTYDMKQHASFADAIAGETSLRTIILALGMGRLTDADTAAIAELLETDVRFVTCVRGSGDFASLPRSIAQRLATRVVELPRHRHDELPTTLANIVAAAVPDATIHYSAIEQALVTSCEVDEDMLLERFRIAIIVWQRTGGTTLRGDDVKNDLENRHPDQFCLDGSIPQRRRRNPPPQ